VNETSSFAREAAACLLVDIQRDFLPGGALAVARGDEVLDPITRLLERDPCALYVATQDWHPPRHISFASSHPGHTPLDVIELYGHEQVLWPDHCLQGSYGAQLHEAIPWQRVSAIIRKGTDPLVDSYSGFRNNWDPHGRRPGTGLAGYLKERGITTILLCGLTRDYCAKWSAEDAAAAGFQSVLLWDCTRPVDPASDEEVRRNLERAGVQVMLSTSLRWES
jgi:nicotinamidase/pyrazinamidase